MLLCAFRGDKQLCLLSCNVRGIADFQKRGSVVDHFIYPKGSNKRPDIFSFQETHSTPEVTGWWDSTFGQNTLYAHGTNSARGVLLGFNPKLDVTVVNSSTDSEGRYIVANLKVQGESLTIVAVYFEPDLSDQAVVRLWTKITKIVHKYENSRVMFCGDFNAILNQNIDTNQRYPKNRDRYFANSWKCRNSLMCGGFYILKRKDIHVLLKVQVQCLD